MKVIVCYVEAVENAVLVMGKDGTMDLEALLFHAQIVPMEHVLHAMGHVERPKLNGIKNHF